MKRTLRLEAAGPARAGRLICRNGPSDGDLDYNDGPGDVPGPNKQEWRRYLGDYRVLLWGKPITTMKVHIKSGYLYADERRLAVEHGTGLFFGADGEAFDFGDTGPTWRSIPLARLP